MRILIDRDLIDTLPYSKDRKIFSLKLYNPRNRKSTIGIFVSDDSKLTKFINFSLIRIK